MYLDYARLLERLEALLYEFIEWPQMGYYARHFQAFQKIMHTFIIFQRSSELRLLDTGNSFHA